VLIKRQKLVLSLFPNRLAGAVYQSGKLQREETILLECDTWQSAWTKGLTPYDPSLRQLLARFRLPASTPISVLYHSPTAMIQVDDNAGTKAEAEAAAVLSMQSGTESGTACNALAIAPSASNSDQWMVLALSEREDTTNALYAWVTRCGGTLHTVQPSQAAVAQDAVRYISVTDERQACCVIGQEWSAVVCGDQNGIELARIFELGYQPLADVFARAYEPGKVLPAPDAERELFKVGIPFKSSSLPKEIRAELLPQLSPIIQRLSIEIKQTLRFGINENEMPPVLTLSGRGASIPELAHVLTDGVDMHVRANTPDTPAASAVQVFTPESSEHSFATFPINPMAITPTPARAERAASVFKRATLAGAVAAVALIAGELAWVSHQSRALEPQFDAISPEIAAMANQRDRIEQASQLANRAGACALAIDQASKAQHDVGPILSLIAESASDSARFSGIEFREDENVPSVFLAGYTVGDTDEHARQALDAAVERLESDARITRVELGAINRETSQDSDQAVRYFSLTAYLEPAPRFFQPLASFAAAQETDE